MKKSIEMIFIVLLCISCCKQEAKISRINYWYKTGFFPPIFGKVRLVNIDTIFENGMIHSSKPENMLIYKIDSIVRHREMWTGEIFSYAKTNYSVKRAMDNANFANDTLYFLSFKVDHSVLYYYLIVSKHNGVYGYIYKLEEYSDGYDGLVFLHKTKIFTNNKVIVSKLDSAFIVNMFRKYIQDPDIF